MKHLELMWNVAAATPTNIIVNTTSLDLNLGEIGTVNAKLNPSQAGSLTVNYGETIITVTQSIDRTWIVTPKAEGNTAITFSFTVENNMLLQKIKPLLLL